LIPPWPIFIDSSPLSAPYWQVSLSLFTVREHRAGTWAAFLAVAASVAFLPVTLGTTFTAARAANQPSEFSISNAVADPQLVLLSMLFLSGMVLLFASFGVSGWMRSGGLGIATSLSLIGAVAAFAALRPFLHVMSTP
jgi:hypothetical protein